MFIVVCESGQEQEDKGGDKEKIRAELPVCGDESDVKPERHVVSGAKSSVSGMDMEAHVVLDGFTRMDFRHCTSNSFTSVVGFWVVVSRYFGEAIGMSLEGDLEDGTRPVIIQTEGVGNFRRHGMSTGRQFRSSS